MNKSSNLLPSHLKDMPRNISTDSSKMINSNNIFSTNLGENLNASFFPKGRISSNPNNENEIIYENVEIVKELSPEGTAKLPKYYSNE